MRPSCRGNKRNTAYLWTQARPASPWHLHFSHCCNENFVFSHANSLSALNLMLTFLTNSCKEHIHMDSIYMTRMLSLQNTNIGIWEGDYLHAHASFPWLLSQAWRHNSHMKILFLKWRLSCGNLPKKKVKKKQKETWRGFAAEVQRKKLVSLLILRGWIQGP